nr:DUF2235 domain-containing protein [Methylobacterium brachythecii]
MAKNIIIFSDGTGQAGGLLPDETRSNVYKLYRATRVCPDTSIDPAHQLAFYDVGLGSKAAGGNIRIAWWRRLYNILGSATGLGITQNIIDCYAAILQVWEPDDRIYLLGFSRGAYTVRCVGAALSLCGVPTRSESGEPLRRDPASAKALASEAIRQVYQFGAGKTEKDGTANKLLEGVRNELAADFRKRYASAAPNDANLSNAYPYFIGVWDTVAALGLTTRRFLGLGLAVAVTLGLLALIMDFFLVRFGHYFSAALFWQSYLRVTGLSAAVAVLAYLAFYVKFTTKSKIPWYETLHLTGWKMVFYNTELNPFIQHARHALSIDENRKEFKNVPWTKGKQVVTVGKKGAETQLIQTWFAGVHSDVGGSYIENEARLSDIALKWMIDQAISLPKPLLVDASVLHLWPSADGPQHDERKATVASWPGWFVWLMTLIWKREELGWKPWVREVPRDAPLDPSVLARLQLRAVLRYDLTEPYRPKALEHHVQAHHLYPPANGV